MPGEIREEFTEEVIFWGPSERKVRFLQKEEGVVIRGGHVWGLLAGLPLMTS